MKLYEIFFGIFVALIFIAGLAVGAKSACGCGDEPPPDTTIEQIKTTAI